MKLRSKSKLLAAAALGFALTAVTAHAQLVVNVRQQATFSGFVGGAPNAVTNNGSINTVEVVTTGTSSTTPFSITYTPLFGSGGSPVTLNTGTLNTTTFRFNNPTTAVGFFSSVNVAIDTDFDNNGVFDVTQNYTLGITPFNSNGFTGVNYSIAPVNFFGNVTINGLSYAYASVVSNSSGQLFDGNNTTSAIQFQFSQAQMIPVPEPSTYALFGVMALGAIVALRRRRAALNPSATLTA